MADDTRDDDPPAPVEPPAPPAPNPVVPVIFPMDPDIAERSGDGQIEKR